MISSVPSYDEELLNGAYANIGLIADKVWAYHQDDPFRKLNHSLWVQSGSIPMQQISNTASPNRASQHQWIQRANPGLHVQVAGCHFPHSPVCAPVQSVCPAMIQRRMQMHDKITSGNGIPKGCGLASAPIPVYQKPPELYNDPSQRRKTQGVDFNNLILLTKSAMKARRNQSKNPQHSSSFILESRQPNLKSETDVLQWLEKGYPKRAKEFVAVNTLVTDFQNFVYECDDRNETKSDATNDAEDKSSPRFGEFDASSEAPAKKRLYRDVLTNSSSSGIVLENVFDRRYDELERQAMEQYRTSEECLALRYQELEQQAMEQYRNGDNCGAGNLTNNQGQIPSTNTPADETQRSIGKSLDCEVENSGSQKCSGFGHCGSPTEDPPSAATASKKGYNLKNGTPPRQPITILRPAIERGANSANRSANSNQCPRPPIVTKSLTALTQRFSLDSKNISRGASGDKIDRTVQASSKRRLILMSPSESQRESDAGITAETTSDTAELFTFQSMNRLQISESYRDSEVIETGGGDEKIAIQRSSLGTEGIRKQLFLANEELMENCWESLAVRLSEPTEKNGPRVNMSLINDPEEHVIIGVSSRTSTDTSVDVARKGDPGDLLFDLLQLGWERCEERCKIKNRLTRNKKKRCKPHDRITVNVKETDTFSSRRTKLDVKRIDVVSYHSALTAVQNPSEPSRKMKLKSRSVSCQNVKNSAEFTQPRSYDERIKFSDNYFRILYPMSDCTSTLCNGENHCAGPRKSIGLTTHNLFGVNGYAKTYHYKSRHEAVCKIHFEFTNLRIFLPLYFVPIFIGRRNCCLCNRKYSTLSDRQI
ncbi:uncharacterized protein LOC105684541 isoform X1 [Athalia rosae]|uniref:uncharacterized protein LOC105684541 isoform X1 n=1 Tax=Athalia rosae TaxID=37344 RepID=UPI00203381CF|nr:uncharacterized protein LOC105684541 isoform X1 [Athalia rosae]XP_048506940.1 uncharacterized protein LOC105684541 isoform X1 [Athalia rosae]